MTPDRSNSVLPPPDAAPETSFGTEALETWDELPSATGGRAVPPPLENETEAQSLVEEGVAEADRELRLEASTEADTEEGEGDDDTGAEDTNPPATGILS